MHPRPCQGPVLSESHLRNSATTPSLLLLGTESRQRCPQPQPVTSRPPKLQVPALGLRGPFSLSSAAPTASGLTLNLTFNPTYFFQPSCKLLQDLAQVSIWKPPQASASFRLFSSALPSEHLTSIRDWLMGLPTSPSRRQAFVHQEKNFCPSFKKKKKWPITGLLYSL